MITKILIGVLVVLTVLITGCEAILPPMVLLDGDANAIPGCEIMMAAVTRIDLFGSEYGPGVVVNEIEVYVNPMNPEPEDLPADRTYVFYPVEYTFTRNQYWVKVLVSFELEYYTGETPDVIEYDLGYRWVPLPIDFPPDQLLGCDALPLTDGIPGTGCEGVSRANRIIPARVGPGLDRAIFINLTSGSQGLKLNVDGYQNSSDGKRWYRIWHSERHLWVDEEDFEGYCQVPLVTAPPILLPSAPQQIMTPTPVTPVQDFAVYYCRHLFGNTFEWHSVRVNYDENGLPMGEQITGGPFTGAWREGCPAGELTLSIEQPSLAAPTLPDDPPPTEEATMPADPTSEPTFTPTPTECMCE